MIDASVRDDIPYNISVTIEPLVRLLLSIPDPLVSAQDSPDKEHDPDAMDILAAVDAAEGTSHCIEDTPRLYCAHTTLADHCARITEDKAAGQCRSDLGVSVDSLSDNPSYQWPPPLCPPPAATPGEYLGASSTHGTPRRRGRRRQASRQDIPSLGGETDLPSCPLSPPRCLPGQSFAIEHHVHEKKSKFRPFLGAAEVEDAKCFVAIELEASGRLGADAVAFLEYLRRFPVLRFRALTSVISAKHNAQMALRWLQYLRR
jgi:hypothetical protein